MLKRQNGKKINPDNGQYGFCQFATYQTFRTAFNDTCTAYECEVDNIDVEYH